MKPKVSVIIPTFNRAHVLKRAIDSVLKQTEEDLELIIVDDASTDNTGELVAQYHDDRVHYICMEQNAGPSKARNYGASCAKGEYIAFQDSDDEWDMQKLQKQLQVFQENETNIGMVYCSFLKKFPEREVYYPPVQMPKKEKSGYVFETLLFRPLVGAPTMLIPRKIWEEVQGYAEELKCFEDWELTMRIALKHQIVLVDEPLVTVYHSENSLVMNGVNAIKADFYILKQFFKYYKTDEMKKEKLDRIARKVSCAADFEAYRNGMQETFGVKM